MTLTVQAVYEHGVLRPVQPLSLPEGRTFEVTIAAAQRAGGAFQSATQAEQDYALRVKAARTLDELLSVVATASPLPEGYDLCAALNANRAVTVEQLLFSQ